MKRVTKEPEERKAELVDAAERLFIEKGYEETAVSEIVKAANVAQGTFYYYFKSKDDIRDAVIDKSIDEVKEITQRTLDAPGLSALDRMLAYFTAFMGWGKQRWRLVVYVHEKKNEVIHFRMSRRALDFTVPAYQKIVEQGIAEGVFHTRYPAEAAKAILGISGSIFDGIDYASFSAMDLKTRRKVRAMLEFIEKVLETEPGLLMEIARNHGVEINESKEAKGDKVP